MLVVRASHADILTGRRKPRKDSFPILTNNHGVPGFIRPEIWFVGWRMAIWNSSDASIIR